VPAPAERICHVTLIANWFESHTPLRGDYENGATYAGASQCR
jgi:hypothetical protein